MEVLVVAATIVLSTLALLSGWPRWRASSRPWQYLALSSLPLVLAGLGFILRFWKPTTGPYLANVRYPFGGYLEAWAVSFGFLWVAFGLLFFVLACSAPPSWRLWSALLTIWCIAWLPHGVIGVASAVAGGNTSSIDVYRRWVSSLPGALVFASSSVILLSHFGLSLVGFIQTARRLQHRSGPEDLA